MKLSHINILLKEDIFFSLREIEKAAFLRPLRSLAMAIIAFTIEIIFLISPYMRGGKL